MASWYDTLLTAGSGPHELATTTTLELAADVRGLDVLDIACGQGMASRALAKAGAGSVLGVDTAEELVAMAKAYEDEAPLGVTYRIDDAQRLTTVADESVDAVSCQLGLMDIPDLLATLASVRRVLRTTGWFVFVVGHPCFLAPDAVTLPGERGQLGRFVCEYFDERFWRSSTRQGSDEWATFIAR